MCLRNLLKYQNMYSLLFYRPHDDADTETCIMRALMQKDVIIRMFLVSAIATTAFSCTSFQEGEVPLKFGVDSEELSFSTDGETQLLTVSSGTKWDVTNMPSWLSLEAISPSGLSLYEWKVSFSVSENNEYDREGIVSFNAGTETIDLPVKQEGKKGLYVAVESVSISPTELTITEGDTHTLTATIIPSNASDKSTTWFSNNTSVATVSSAGVVTAKAVGDARIFVQTNDGRYTANCFVSVKSKKVSVTGVSLNKTSLSMTVGDTQALTATVTPSNATDKSVEWSSNNKEVAVVVLTSEGRAVYAQSPGTATIMVKTTDGGKTATCSVTVKAATISVTGVSLDKTSLSMTVGDTQTLTATVLPTNATVKSVTWSSSNTSVATVSYSGVILAKSAGSATITVMTVDGSKRATCSVNVVDYNGNEYVDLGLPSGLKWATCNVGASQPEEYGDYFAWGETTSKDKYDWTTYKWESGKLTKYCYDSSYGYNGFTDTKTVLDMEDDAANVNFGGSWRIPTDAEWTELRENCSWTWTTKNSVRGRLVTSNKNGLSIFLPAAGYRINRSKSSPGFWGDYCSSSLYTTGDPSVVWGVSLGSDRVERTIYPRYYGLSVRPVSE